MKRRSFLRVLTFGAAAGALIFTSCSTTETRISGHPEIYQSLSPSDQALVSQGQIRTGMSPNAVWLAWGSPDQKIAGNMRGRSTETWIYINYTTYPYSYPYPYYGPGFGYGFGLTSVGVAGGSHHHHGGRTFVFFGRSVLLFIHPTKHPVPLQDSYFRQWQGRILPVPGAAVSLLKNSVAFCHGINQSRGTPRKWLTAPFESSSTLLNKRAS